MCASTRRTLPSPVGLPDLAQQRLALQHPAGPGGQGGEQVELGTGQVDDGAVDADLAAVLVHLELGEPADVLLDRRGGLGGGGDAGTAQHHLHPGDQLARGERLGHVPVRADREADQEVDLLGARGQHEHVALGLGADLTAHLGAVGVGQPEIQDDDVGSGATDLLERLGARAHGTYVHPGPG